MSGDPLAGGISDPQTLNRYAYVRNNPINFTDPTGMFYGPGGPEPPPDDGGDCCDTWGGPYGNTWLGPIGPPPPGPPPPPPPPPAPKRLTTKSDCLDGNGRWIDYQLTDANGKPVTDQQYGVTEHHTNSDIVQTYGYPNQFNDWQATPLLSGQSVSDNQTFTIAPGPGINNTTGVQVPVQMASGKDYAVLGIYRKNVGGSYPLIIINGTQASTVAPPGKKCPEDNLG